jgi:hypothetical protein
MKSQMRIATSAVLLFLLFTSMTPRASAGLVTSLTVNTSPEPGGLTLYSYTLSDLASSTLPAVEFTLSVSPTANLGAITGPSGWQITYQAGDSEVDFASPSDATDILPGSQGVFSFTSALTPVSTDYLIIGFDSSTITIDTNQGQIAGPATAVPEPCSLHLLCLALVLPAAAATGRRGYRHLRT